MLTDNRRYVRQMAVNHILNARKSATKNLRRFVKPKLNMAAKNYIDMINWSQTHISDQNILRKS
jgi:hypothetical protein